MQMNATTAHMRARQLLTRIDDSHQSPTHAYFFGWRDQWGWGIVTVNLGNGAYSSDFSATVHETFKTLKEK